MIYTTVTKHAWSHKMKASDVDAHAVASFRKFYKLIPRNKDTTLLILKLHLLVEEQVRAFVNERMQTREALSRTRLDCHQVICLAEALSAEPIIPNIWEAARKLNTLRNDIAHKLEPKGVLDRMSNITALIGVNLETIDVSNRTQEVAVVDNFIYAASMLHNAISAFVPQSHTKCLTPAPESSEA